jgi:glycosyltransferase involved in cell wall biosynthesis
VADNELLNVIEKLHYIDMMAVSYYREKTVKTLVDAGFKVTLYGTGWEVCDWIDNENLDYRGRVSADEIVDLMYDSKIVLNTMTWFKDGTHDRVFNGMLAGAVAVTDSSIYMKENFTDNELVMFELEDIDKLPHIINDLVTDKYKMQKIADEGRKKALQFHSWEKRADELYYDLISQL